MSFYIWPPLKFTHLIRKNRVNWIRFEFSVGPLRLAVAESFSPQESRTRSKFSQSGGDSFRAAGTATFRHDDSTERISVLGMGEEDHLRWEKLCGPRERAEKCDSHRAGAVPEATVSVRQRGVPHPGATVLQQPPP